MSRNSFLVNFQVCRYLASNFTNIWTPSQVYFKNIFKPQLPLSIDSSPPLLIKFWRVPPLYMEGAQPPPPCSQHLWETLGYLPIWEMGNFARRIILCGGRNLRGGVVLTIQTFFKAKKQYIAKIPPVGVAVKFCREENVFYWVF